MTAKVSAHHNSVKTKPIIWTISGADCSGGAGIAADIKTGHSLNVEVCHLITANTVQNSKTLLAINPVEIATLTEQVNVLRFDKPPSAIKIGLIANLAQLQWLITSLERLKKQWPNLQVVYDPVGQATVGGALSQVTVNQLIPLLSLVDVITPNVPEAQSFLLLTHSCTKQTTNADKLANNLLQWGCKSVIIKGGHALNTDTYLTEHYCTDTCLTRTTTLAQFNSPDTKTSNTTQRLVLQSQRIKTGYSHGGGCSFASAIASFLAHGYLLRDAFTLTKAFINQGLTLTENINVTEFNDSPKQYYGAFEQGQWPEKLSYFPKIISSINHKNTVTKAFNSLGLKADEKLGLYPVVDSLEWLERLLPLKIKIIQLRIKHQDSKTLSSLIKKAVAMTKAFQSRLFINDHWQLAIEHKAYGVHLGQEDLASANLNAIANEGLRIGISTHGCYEFLLAKQLRPSYLAIGAIFETQTKNMTGQIQGVDNLRKIMSLAESIPVVAIGGINQQRIDSVWSTGVSAIAVVTAITKAIKPIIATQDLQAQLC